MPASSARTRRRGASSGCSTTSTTSAGPTRPNHPLTGSEILREKGYPEEVITCILSHADYLADRYPRRTTMEKGLYACDEITGLITATALMRPTGIGDLTASSVKKKMKTKGFAKGVNRDDVIRGAADFGVDLDEHIQFVIDAMKTIAAELGLEKAGAVRTRATNRESAVQIWLIFGHECPRKGLETRKLAFLASFEKTSGK